MAVHPPGRSPAWRREWRRQLPLVRRPDQLHRTRLPACTGLCIRSPSGSGSRVTRSGPDTRDDLEGQNRGRGPVSWSESGYDEPVPLTATAGRLCVRGSWGGAAEQPGHRLPQQQGKGVHAFVSARNSSLRQIPASRRLGRHPWFSARGLRVFSKLFSPPFVLSRLRFVHDLHDLHNLHNLHFSAPKVPDALCAHTAFASRTILSSLLSPRRLATARARPPRHTAPGILSASTPRAARTRSPPATRSGVTRARLGHPKKPYATKTATKLLDCN
jgi:hypothetical protein